MDSKTQNASSSTGNTVPIKRDHFRAADPRLIDTRLSHDSISPITPTKPSFDSQILNTSGKLPANSSSTEPPSPIVNVRPTAAATNASSTTNPGPISQNAANMAGQTSTAPLLNENTQDSILNPVITNSGHPTTEFLTGHGHRWHLRNDHRKKNGIPHSPTVISTSSTPPPSANPPQGEAKSKRGRAILFAFAVVFFPMIVIVLILLAFVFYGNQRILFLSEADGTTELPVHPVPPKNAYYTTVGVGSYLLVSSWASNVAEAVVAPFMLLFSFFVASEIARLSEKYGSDVASSELLHEILSGELSGAWHWIQYITVGRKKASKTTSSPSQRAVHVAALGLFLAGLLSILVIVGDNWLHITTKSLEPRFFEPITYPAKNASSSPLDFYASGWTTIESCEPELTTPPPQNISDAPLPCSLNGTNRLTNVANPQNVYLTLDTGISQQTASFNDANFTALDRSSGDGTATVNEIVTFVDPKSNLSHSFFFFADSAQEYDDNGYKNIGVDYVANTTSMVTECTFATGSCGLASVNNSFTNQTLSIPYSCYPDFSGDLGVIPSTGLERVQGWNSSFYQLVNGVPENIPIQAQLNPFNFYAAAAVSSISFALLQESGDNQAANGSVIDAGNGRTAFALSCQATIYDVTYSLINGSIAQFNATPSDPRKASIIKAPLQAGFGQYNLFQSASLAILATDPVTTIMAKAFSQTGMALASGVFTYDVNIAQRFRYDLIVTQVHKAPFWYLNICCLLVATLGFVLTAVAVGLRRSKKVRSHQLKLMPKVFSEDFEFKAPAIVDFAGKVNDANDANDDEFRRSLDST